jgi:hypothetical protein
MCNHLDNTNHRRNVPLNIIGVNIMFSYWTMPRHLRNAYLEEEAIDLRVNHMSNHEVDDIDDLLDDYDNNRMMLPVLAGLTLGRERAVSKS